MARRPSRNIPLVGRHLRGLLDLLIFGLLSPASFQGADAPDEEAADDDENDAAGGEPCPHHSAGGLGLALPTLMARKSMIFRTQATALLSQSVGVMAAMTEAAVTMAVAASMRSLALSRIH